MTIARQFQAVLIDFISIEPLPSSSSNRDHYLIELRYAPAI